MSLNSLDRVGVRLLSPCGSQILQLQMQVQVILLQLTITSSGGSSTRTLSDTTCLFLMISSGAQLGVIGTVVACWVFLLFWRRSRAMSVLGDVMLFMYFD